VTRLGIAWRLALIAGVAAAEAYAGWFYWHHLYVPEPCPYATGCGVGTPGILLAIATMSLTALAMLLFVSRGERWHDNYDGCESCNWQPGLSE